MKDYAEVLESYLIPAIEAFGNNPFTYVFQDIYKTSRTDYEPFKPMEFINPVMKIQNKTYKFDNPCNFITFLRTVVLDNWTEKDFIKAVENNIKYTPSEYWYSDIDQKRSKHLQNVLISHKDEWDKMECFPIVFLNRGSDCYLYSKAKHAFIWYCSDVTTFKKNINQASITWDKAIKGFKAELDPSLKLDISKKTAEKIVEDYGLSNKFIVFIDKKENALCLKISIEDYKSFYTHDAATGFKYARTPEYYKYYDMIQEISKKLLMTPKVFHAKEHYCIAFYSKIK